MTTPSTHAAVAPGGLLGWWHEATPAAKRALVAASLGWMLDSFDGMLYSLVLAYLMSDRGRSTTTAGLLGCRSGAGARGSSSACCRRS